jgi:allantoinase
MRSHGRYDYLPIEGRPDYAWPEGKRLAVYLGLNLEHFSFGEGLGAELAPGGPPPDVLNYAWRDYGNRVGAWRMRRMFEELALPASVLVNASLYDYCPDLVATFAGRGDELVGHGETNSERQCVLDEQEEAALIRRSAEAIDRRAMPPPTSSRRRGSPISSTGAATTSRSGCGRGAAGSSPSPTRRSSTTSRRSRCGARRPASSPT